MCSEGGRGEMCSEGGRGEMCAVRVGGGRCMQLCGECSTCIVGLISS